MLLGKDPILGWPVLPVEPVKGGILSISRHHRVDRCNGLTGSTHHNMGILDRIQNECPESPLFTERAMWINTLITILAKSSVPEKSQLSLANTLAC